MYKWTSLLVFLFFVKSFAISIVSEFFAIFRSAKGTLNDEALKFDSLKTSNCNSYLQRIFIFNIDATLIEVSILSGFVHNDPLDIPILPKHGLLH